MGNIILSRYLPSEGVCFNLGLQPGIYLLNSRNLKIHFLAIAKKNFKDRERSNHILNPKRKIMRHLG